MVSLFSLLFYFRASVPLLMMGAQQRNLPVLFLTSLVWRSLWLGIEPGTSSTHSQN